jgi:hypothetical protein
MGRGWRSDPLGYPCTNFHSGKTQFTDSAKEASNVPLENPLRVCKYRRSLVRARHCRANRRASSRVVGSLPPG